MTTTSRTSEFSQYILAPSPSGINCLLVLFRSLYFICKSESPQTACEATANVYYEAVRAFGRKKPDEDVPAEGQRFTAYHQAVEELNEQVEKAKAAGVL